MTSDRRTRLFTGADVRHLLNMADCIDAVESVFELHARGGTPAPAVASVHVEGGGFHVKAAANLDRHYFVSKTNGNFPANPSKNGLPTIQGIIVLCDATDGRPLAVLDSAEITTIRTAAATAVAARHLARPDSAVATIIGCGTQGRAQLRAIVEVLQIERVLALDLDPSAAGDFCEWVTREIGLPAAPVHATSEATLRSDVVVTCTTSRRPLLGPADVRPGTFVAAVGADNPEKQEIEPALLREAAVVVDVLEQCVAFGDLHHAVAAGVLAPDSVRGELGEVVIGTKPGRLSDDEVIVFDSTGTALQDVAAAALVYERADELSGGRTISFTE